MTTQTYNKHFAKRQFPENIYYSFCDVGLPLLQFKNLLYPCLEADIFQRCQFLRYEKQRKQHGDYKAQYKSCCHAKKTEPNLISVFANRLTNTWYSKLIVKFFFRSHSETESSFLLPAVWWPGVMKSCARSRKKGLTPRYKSCWSRFWEESQLSETDILGEQACLPLQTKWKQSLNDF